MTGAAGGKIPIKANVFVVKDKEKKQKKANVYIHLKGYARARVTHLDIEEASLARMIPGGDFLSIYGIDGGIMIKTKKGEINIKNKKLNKVLKEGEKTRTWVGSKVGGIYIGFRKEHIPKLEKIAKR